MNILLLALIAATTANTHVYTVRVDAALERLDVSACFADGLPDRLVADDAAAVASLLTAEITVDGESRTVHPRGNALLFPVPSDDGCLRWQQDLTEITKPQKMTYAYRIDGEPGAVIIRPQSWFWRPWRLTANRNIEFRFDLPPGISLSVPWQPLDASPPYRRFVYGHTPFDWPALMALGDLHMEDVRVPGSVLHLAATDGPAPRVPALIRRWLKPAALAVSTMTGVFPREHLQVLVVPLPGGRDAAPWAEITRGGAPAAHFYMNGAAEWPVFRDDWIATHELSHLTLPFIDRRDAWLSEGFASYYQNVLRARVGLLSEREAWQELHEGFERGRKGTGSLSLRDAVLERRDRGDTMRVYWTGAAMALLADIALREKSGGAWSLDRVIAEFRECCMDNSRAWRAKELFAEFDRISGMEIFGGLYEKHVYSQFFPNLHDVYAKLGIEAASKRVRLNENAPQANLRRAIMRKPAESVAGE